MSLETVQTHCSSDGQFDNKYFFFISGKMELNTADIIRTKVIKRGEGKENTNIFCQLSDDCTVWVKFDGGRCFYCNWVP